ncbi:hypothetical protein H7849_16445 [Alloacidobacterium dinghuense]|uniref:Uncharacterized protein n=1 Tax=Alloacidobacterium dinghuense TaxID=2763107 RepID=A0A7G8BDU0_9BACT|nr:hypothetical protein [Alloacidobacterium dinghuense]QNI30710.1 hypothetical protein H7849_16445 [Alloacidobacterium dinghuense]
MNPHPNPANDVERQIDAALHHLLAQAQAPANLEHRIHARLLREAEQHRGFAVRFGAFVSQRIVFASVAAALACIAIVIGSVQHSHQRVIPATGVHLPVPGNGLGAASGARIAPQPVAVPERGAHSRSERKATGRATVSRDAHKPKGVAVPQSTEPEKP